MAWPDTVRRDDLRIDCTRGSGAGGQNRNKRDTAVRMTHRETGLVGYSEDQRSQVANRKVAWKRLCAKLVPLMRAEAARPRHAAPSERVRTYHEPDQRVTDARVPGRQWRYESVLHGDALGSLMRSVAEQVASAAMAGDGRGAADAAL